jgi:phosphatidylglycerol:prolipoprotein diacylglycerol transferase
VLFYKPGLPQPPHPVEGGMSFHGGLLGVIAAILLFAIRNKVDPFMLSDLVAIVAPIGLFFGRLANFINGELRGRTTDVAWAMIFPRGGPVPRHPSQLYQAFFEGALFAVLPCGALTDGRRRRPADRRLLRGLWRRASRASRPAARCASRLSVGPITMACCCRCCCSSAPG